MLISFPFGLCLQLRRSCMDQFRWLLWRPASGRGFEVLFAHFLIACSKKSCFICEEFNFVMIVLVGLQMKAVSLIPRFPWSGLGIRLGGKAHITQLCWKLVPCPDPTFSCKERILWHKPKSRSSSRNLKWPIKLQSSNYWSKSEHFNQCRLWDSFFNTDQFVILHYTITRL